MTNNNTNEYQFSNFLHDKTVIKIDIDVCLQHIIHTPSLQ